jgi:hypothetical protein
VRPMLGFKILLLGRHHSGRHRNGSHDAQAPRPLRLQPGSFSQGAVRGNCSLKSVRRNYACCVFEYLQHSPAPHSNFAT